MNHRWIVAASLVFVLGRAVSAGAEGIAVGGGVGTLGFGVGLTGRLADTVNIRATFHPGPNFNYEGTSDDVEYEFDLRLLSAGGQLDFHPGGGGFHLSGGVLLNRNKLDAVGAPAGSYDIGDTTYTGAQVGSLRGAIEFKDASPYVGLGFGNAVGKGKRLGLVFDLGVVFVGSPEVDLSATGPAASDPGFQQDLAEEEQRVSDDLKAFKYYPILSLGLTYQF